MRACVLCSPSEKLLGLANMLAQIVRQIMCISQYIRLLKNLGKEERQGGRGLLPEVLALDRAWGFKRGETQQA